MSSRSQAMYNVVICATLFCIVSSSLLLVNKFALSYYAFPNMVLLLQLASSAVLARLAGTLGWAEVDPLTSAKIRASIPLTIGFYLALFTGMNALSHINVDTFILMKTCTPITVAIYEYLFANYVMPSTRTWLSLSLVVVFTAASFSTQIYAISLAGAFWLAVWFLSLTFYMIYAVHYVTAVQLTVMGRVYYENLLCCVPAVAMVLAKELRPGLVSNLWGWGGGAVAASCIMGFAMSGLSWNLRKSISALSHTVLGVANKLLAVAVNSWVWDKHGPVLSQVLLVLGILSSTLYQQPVKAKAHTAASRLSRLRLLLATVVAAGSVVVLVWLGVCFGTALNQSVGVSPSGGLRIHVADLQPALVHQIMAGEQAAERLLQRVWAHTHFTAFGGGRKVITLRSARRELSPEYFRNLTVAASKPFHITLMNSVFWTMRSGPIGNCSLDGVPLDCRMHLSGKHQETADVLYYHIPGGAPHVSPKYHPNQLRLGMSLESGAYYPSLDDPGYMCQFDAEMSFRTCAQVVNFYSVEAFTKIFSAPVKFEEKAHALAYINSNCGTQSGRREIMRSLMKVPGSKVPVHSLGRCDTNKPWPGSLNKHAVFRRYKFCVAMENSIRYDYLTEKIWDALIAGCIPIYMGTPNVYRYMPHPNAVIMYGPGGNATTPEELDALMDAIGSDKARYEAMLAWKTQPVEELGPLFQELYSIRHIGGECRLCQFLAKHRMAPQPHYTTCLFNQSWMAAAGHTVDSSLHPGTCKKASL